MPTEDMERFIAYYSEMIDDRMEDGMTEEEAVAMMDTPDDAVDQILEEFRPDYILHLASFSSVAYSWEHPADCFRWCYFSVIMRRGYTGSMAQC